MIDQNKFIQKVQSELLGENDSHYSRQEVIHIIQATLETLGERLAPAYVHQLEVYLPSELSNSLRKGSARSERFALYTFFKRVARRETTNLVQAVHHTRTVISALKEMVPSETIDQLQAGLPREYGPLFQPVLSLPHRHSHSNDWNWPK